jgi:hypothetical protein
VFSKQHTHSASVPVAHATVNQRYINRAELL